jgi:hypothetical protein
MCGVEPLSDRSRYSLVWVMNDHVQPTAELGPQADYTLPAVSTRLRHTSKLQSFMQVP